MPAQVKEVFVKEGEHVQKGQLILTFDDRGLKAKSDEAKSGYNMAVTSERAARYKVHALQNGLHKIRSGTRGFFGHIKGALSGAKGKSKRLAMELRQAEMQTHLANAGVARAKASEEEVNANSDLFNIKSPISGYCTTRSVQPGDTVSPGQILLTLVDLDSLYL